MCHNEVFRKQRSRIEYYLISLLAPILFPKSSSCTTVSHVSEAMCDRGYIRKMIFTYKRERPHSFLLSPFFVYIFAFFRLRMTFVGAITCSKLV